MKDFVWSNSYKKSKMNVDSVNPALKCRVFQFVWRRSSGKVKPSQFLKRIAKPDVPRRFGEP